MIQESGPAQVQQAERLLNEASDYLAAALARPDDRAWWQLLNYCPPALLADFMQARIYRRIEEIRRGEG